jgi:hypothetical protein
VIYQNVKQSIQEEELDWNFLSRLSIPIWLKDISKIKSLVELVAKTEYRRAGAKFGIKS